MVAVSSLAAVASLNRHNSQQDPKYEGQHVALRKCAAPGKNCMSTVTHKQNIWNICV